MVRLNDARDKLVMETWHGQAEVSSPLADTRQSLTPFTQPPRQIAWQQKPATYFVCTGDLATPAEVQRRRVGAGARVVEFDAGHHPFLSRPDAFAQTSAAEIDFAGSPSI